MLVSTIPSTARLVNLFSPFAGLWAADLCGTDPTKSPCAWAQSVNYSDMDVFIGNPPTLVYNIPLAATPVMLVGTGSGGGRLFCDQPGSRSQRRGLQCTSIRIEHHPQRRGDRQSNRPTIRPIHRSRWANARFMPWKTRMVHGSLCSTGTAIDFGDQYDQTTRWMTIARQKTRTVKRSTALRMARCNCRLDPARFMPNTTPPRINW